MIIDVHYHLWPVSITHHILEITMPDVLHAAKIIGIECDKDELIKKAKKRYFDRIGKKLIKNMDEAGIDFTVVNFVDNASNKTVTADLIQKGNKMVADIVKEYPSRLIALAGVDPRRPEAPDMLKQCFEEFGMKGLKYHPDFGYDPSSPDSYLLLEYLEKNNGILLTHTGPLQPTRAKFADPMILSDVCVDFPDLKIIAAHMGLINWRPWASLAAMQPNLYGDLAMWAPITLGRFKLFCRELRDIIDYVGVEKILFGSDNPVYEIIFSVKDWIKKLKNLPNDAPNGIKFTDEEINAILGGNAAKLLGLINKT